MSVIWQLISLILRALVPVVAENARDRAEDARDPGKLEARLREQIRKDGWK